MPSVVILALVAARLALKHALRNFAISSAHQYSGQLLLRDFLRGPDWSQAETISSIVNVTKVSAPVSPEGLFLIR